MRYTTLLLVLLSLFVVAGLEQARPSHASALQRPCSIEGWVYLDTNRDGRRQQWPPYNETGVLNDVVIQLSNGMTRVSSGGWYGFNNLPAGDYVVSEVQPSGYSSTSPDVITVSNCNARVIDRNFGEIAAAPTPTVAATPVPTPSLPFKGGLAISNEITLAVAQRMGVRRVLLYWGTPPLVNEAISRGLKPVVGLSDCNLTPARWSQLATVARDHPGLTYMFLNEPDIKAQSGASCGARTDPYDDGYDLTKAAHQFAAVTGVVLSADPTARFIYGNEAVARMVWTNRFRDRFSELYGDFQRVPNTVLGVHLYPRWWAGESVSDLSGYAARLERALAAASGNIIVTELNASGAADEVRLFHYLDAILTAEPRVESYFWLSWGDAPLLDSSGNFTPLGWAFVEESQR